MVRGGNVSDCHLALHCSVLPRGSQYTCQKPKASVTRVLSLSKFISSVWCLETVTGKLLVSIYSASSCILCQPAWDLCKGPKHFPL